MLRRPGTAAREREARAALAALSGRVEQLSERIALLEELQARAELAAADRLEAFEGRLLDELRPQLAQLAPPGDLATVPGRLGQLDRRLWETQNLVGRIYEQAQGWPEQLAALRADPAYERAYSGAPLVSVMVPTRDRAQLLCERALPSVLRQTYQHWEAIVVADECSDDTVERVAALGDERIRLIEHRRSEARPEDEQHAWLIGGVPPGNAALRAARGDWLARLDDDDELDDGALEVLVRTALQTHSEVVYSRLRVLGDGFASEIGSWPPRQSDFSWIGAVYHGALRVWERDAICRWLGEPADWHYARRMLAAGVRFHFLDQVLGTYRPDYLTSDGLAWWRARARDRPLADTPA